MLKNQIDDIFFNFFALLVRFFFFGQINQLLWQISINSLSQGHPSRILLVSLHSSVEGLFSYLLLFLSSRCLQKDLNGSLISLHESWSVKLLNVYKQKKKINLSIQNNNFPRYILCESLIQDGLRKLNQRAKLAKKHYRETGLNFTSFRATTINFRFYQFYKNAF